MSRRKKWFLWFSCLMVVGSAGVLGVYSLLDYFGPAGDCTYIDEQAGDFRCRTGRWPTQFSELLTGEPNGRQDFLRRSQQRYRHVLKLVSSDRDTAVYAVESHLLFKTATMRVYSDIDPKHCSKY